MLSTRGCEEGGVTRKRRLACTILWRGGTGKKNYMVKIKNKIGGGKEGERGRGERDLEHAARSAEDASLSALGTLRAAVVGPSQMEATWLRVLEARQG
eukprot:1915205-Rhodomonas_salina.1